MTQSTEKLGLLDTPCTSRARQEVQTTGMTDAGPTSMNATAKLGLWTLALVAACATPGKLYDVSPAIEGTLWDGQERVRDGTLVLSVRHRETGTLGRTVRAELDGEGRFSFEPVRLAVAGQEHSKEYQLLLHFEDESAGGRDRLALWRSDYSRHAVGEAIALECFRDTPAGSSLPCRVVGGPGGHPWLIAAGAEDFARFCTSCHGRDGSGDGPAGPALRTAPADLTRIAARRGGEFPRAEIAQWIDGRLRPASHGTREMPIWGVQLGASYAPGDFAEALVRGRIDNLLTYLETIQVEMAEQ